MRYIERLLKSPFTGILLLLAGIAWDATPDSYGPKVVAVGGALQAFGRLFVENWQLKRAREPRLALVFKPQTGEPYVIEKKSNYDVWRVYRVGIANSGDTTVDNVAVLLASFRPEEKAVRLFHEMKRMGQDPELIGSRFQVSGNSAEPRVFVDVIAQKFNPQTHRGGMPEVCLARGEHGTPLWDWKETKMYHFTVVGQFDLADLAVRDRRAAATAPPKISPKTMPTTMFPIAIPKIIPRTMPPPAVSPFLILPPTSSRLPRCSIRATKRRLPSLA